MKPLESIEELIRSNSVVMLYYKTINTEPEERNCNHIKIPLRSQSEVSQKGLMCRHWSALWNATLVFLGLVVFHYRSRFAQSAALSLKQICNHYVMGGKWGGLLWLAELTLQHTYRYVHCGRYTS